MMKLNPLCVNDNAASRQRLPPRVAKRPDPCQWSEDELMSLAEAAALFWPDGPLSVASLRTAIAGGQLHVAVVARKFLTTKASITRMSLCGPRMGPRMQQAAIDPKLKIYERIDGLRSKST
jgi:hypothetical protein